jgi:hypothetical protein
MSTAADQARGTFWPFKPRSALLAAPAVLVAALAVLGIAQVTMDWPVADSFGRVLLMVVTLSLIPIVLFVLDGMVRQRGAVEWGGVTLSFATPAAPAGEAVPANAAVPGVPVADSANDTVLRTAESMAQHRILLVDLGDGRAWWETRLLMLCGVASRLYGSAAVVFVTEQGGQARQFVGWADSQSLLDRMLTMRPQLRAAYDSAAADSIRHATAATVFGLLDPADDEMPDVRPSNRHLAAHMRRLEGTEPTLMSATAVRDMFLPVLRTATVGRVVSDADWIRSVLSSEDEYIAIVDDGVYVGLLSRATAVNRILLSLMERQPEAS